jgi:colicin import membrane protein
MSASPLNPTAMALATGPSLRPPARDAWGPGVALALLAHALLVAALAWGVAWRSHQPEALEAEMWAAIPDAEAPPPVVTMPPPTPPVAEPPPAPPEPVEPVPDLVIAKKKPPKEPRPERKPREVETFDSTPVKPRKTDPTQAPDLKARQAREQAARDKADQDAKAALALEKAREKAALAQAEAEAAAAEAQRQQILKDIVRRAGGGANPTATGTGARNAGPSEAYSGRLRALFKRNLTWALEDVSGNPETVVRITLSPSGAITSRTIVSASGLPAWDDAVLRAIDRTALLPADETGRVQPSMTLGFRMKDY